MILLRLISWQYFRKHVLRSLLTMAGIALGVAVFVGMHTANESVLYAFHQTVDRIAGAAQLQITAGDGGFPEEVLERVQSLPEVRVAVPIIEAPVQTGLRGEGNLLILAVDMTGDRSLRQYEFDSADDSVIEDPLVFLAQPDSLIITSEFAARNGLGVNSRLPLITLDGVRQFTVRGIMRSGGMTRAFGGSLAIMDIYAAQKVFGRGRSFDRIDLAAKDGVAIEQCQAAIEKLLGPGFQVETPAARGRQFDSILRMYAISVNISSLFALFIGMFIIYNSFAIAVTQRRGEIGILRALGATRRQVRTLFLGESAIAGLLGSLAGVGFGLLIARGIAGYISGLLVDFYGVAQRADEVAAHPQVLGTALALGILTSLFAAWIPARNAARVDPVQALQKGKYQVLSAGENRVRRWTAVALLALSTALLAFSRTAVPFYVGYLMASLAAILLTPTITPWLTRLLRPLLRWVRPVEGTLAADSLLQSPRRTSATVAALMLSLAMVIGLGGVARASHESILEWFDTALNPDLFVASSQQISDRSVRFPPSIAADLAAIDAIAEVQTVRSARIQFRRTPILVVASELGIIGHRVPTRPVAGDKDEMYRLAAQGRGVIASENLAEIHGLRLGQTLELATPGGWLRLPIVGINRDYSDQQGAVLLDRSVFLRYWGDDTVNLFRIYLNRGASPDEVKRRILDRFPGERRLMVLSNQEVRATIVTLTNQWFGLSYVQLGVAALVAILGIINTLTVSITDRRRELGVLRAVGGLRSQVRRTVWIEAISIGLLGLLLGVGLGLVNLYYILELGHRLAGLRLDYTFPFQVAALLFPAILVAAFISALGPAEGAVRGSLVEALEYE